MFTRLQKRRRGMERRLSFGAQKKVASLLFKFYSDNRNVVTDMLLTLFIIEPAI